MTVAFLIPLLSLALRPTGTSSCDLKASETQRELGERAFRQDQFAEAAQSFQKAFDLCPAHDSNLLRVSQAEARRHESAASIDAAKRYLQLKPDSLEGALVLANSFFMAQKMPEALQEAQAVLNKNPQDAEALKIKGNVEYLTGHSDEAVRDFLTLLESHPNDQDGSYMLGRIYYQEGRIEQAAGQFQRVLRMDPKSFKALDNLGLCYQALGDRDLAARYFLTSIKTSEESGDAYDWAYANLANLLLENGDAERAFAAASKAADRNPYSARDFFLGGKALQALGKDDLSVNWLERSAALDPKYPDPLYLLAKVYKKLGQQAKADAALDKFRIVKANAPRERK